MILCASLFCVMGALFKVLGERGVSILWVGWMRFFVGLVAMIVPAAAGLWSLKVNNRPLFVWRGVIGASGQFLLVVAVAWVGLGRGTVLLYLMGMFGALSSMVLLKERPSPAIWLALLAATAGVLLSCHAGLPEARDLLAILGALLSGVALTLVRMLRRTDSNQVTFFSQSLFGSVLLVVPALCSAPPAGWANWGLILLMGSSAALGHLAMNKGLRLVPVAHGVTLMMLTPIFSVLLGVWLFGESMTAAQWLGCLLVIGSSTLAAAAPRQAPIDAQAATPAAPIPRPQ